CAIAPLTWFLSHHSISKSVSEEPWKPTVNGICGEWSDMRVEEKLDDLAEVRAGAAMDTPSPSNTNMWSEYDGRLAAVWGEIVALGLEKHVAEVEALGYTVVDPKVSDDVVEGMRESIFRKAEAHWGPGARDGSVFNAEDRDFD